MKTSDSFMGTTVNQDLGDLNLGPDEEANITAIPVEETNKLPYNSQESRAKENNAKN